ncbi:STAS domain-containing protein [Modestobacter muralis]|uniref:Anti-sigma factor antagonist n=1 Tax=Modestobacter muralis TaxID=1608614 RepID=A0A6P0EPP8_9ACTN|nr:STAS domain-containing protein [Modestobacter muralis]NEK93542.1 STAS domain-containing protein [Modestobacter muralis]NEN50309.1 STAS domain-containing protein [Modestobacter muralis]
MIELDTEHGPDVAVVRPRGRLTMVHAADLRAVVAEALADGRTRVVIDLAHCEFMDSSGLGAIIGGLKAARQAGGDLRIAALQPQVMTVLQLTNLDRVLRPHGSVAEALRGD